MKSSQLILLDCFLGAVNVPWFCEFFGCYVDVCVCVSSPATLYIRFYINNKSAYLKITVYSHSHILLLSLTLISSAELCPSLSAQRSPFSVLITDVV